MTTQASAPQALGYVGVRAKDLGDWASGASRHTRRIAEYVSQLSYARIPAEVRERLKLLILDSLGCAIYGADLEWCRIPRQTLERVDQTKTTSIWGTDRRLSSPHAALVNGTQVQSFELDDVHRDRKSTRLNSSHEIPSRMPSSA